MSEMSSSRWLYLLPVLCGAAASSSCSSSHEEPVILSFVPEDCRGGLVELVRLPSTFTASADRPTNNLAIEGDTLFMTYAFASSQSGLPTGGGIVAVPVSGGLARVVAAAQNTSQWGTGQFWASGGQIYMQTDVSILSVPADSPTPSTVPVVLSGRLYEAYAHDAEFGYVAQGDHPKGLRVVKVPIAGGTPVVLVDEPLPNVVVGGIADAGDALLLQVRWHPEPTYDHSTLVRRVWRIPKDGTPRSDVRPDVEWSDSLTFTQWLAWDGSQILGSTIIENYVVQSRVAPTGTSAPEQLKLYGTVATRRGDEILSLQTVALRGGPTRLLVASSKGDPAGRVVVCGPEGSGTPLGIVATDSDIYASYRDDDDVVITRVVP